MIDTVQGSRSHIPTLDRQYRMVQSQQPSLDPATIQTHSMMAEDWIDHQPRVAALTSTNHYDRSNVRDLWEEMANAT